MPEMSECIFSGISLTWDNVYHSISIANVCARRTRWPKYGALNQHEFAFVTEQEVSGEQLLVLAEQFSEFTPRHWMFSWQLQSSHLSSNKKRKKGCEDDNGLPRNHTSEFCLNAIIQNPSRKFLNRNVGTKLTNNIHLLSSVYLQFFPKPCLKSQLLQENFFTCCWPHSSLIPVDFHFNDSRFM